MEQGGLKFEVPCKGGVGSNTCVLSSSRCLEGVDTSISENTNDIPGTVMFFEGDQIIDAAHREDLQDLIDPLSHLGAMQDKWPGWRVLL